MFANNSQQAYVSPHFLHSGENQMRSHPDYHARLLPFELGFRGTQWLKAMDYEGLPKKSLQNDPPHQVAGRVCGCLREQVCLICPAKWNNILHINPNRKLGNQRRVKDTDGHNPTRAVKQEEQICRNERNVVSTASNQLQQEPSAALNDSQLH